MRCSKLCSDRVDKRQIGTRRDRSVIGLFLAGNSEFWGDVPEADRVLIGLVHRRLQRLGSACPAAARALTGRFCGSPAIVAGPHLLCGC